MQQLHIKQKVLSLHGKMKVLDNDENEVYNVESKMISIHNKTYIHNVQGEQIAFISRKPISIHEVHDVEMSDGTKFQLRTEWFHVVQDVIDIEGLGWHLHGDFLQHNYEIWDETGKTVATTHMKWLSIHQISYIDILDESKQDIVVALFVALERIIDDRVAASTTTASTVAATNIQNNN